jgi:UDP-N-acetylglucosamine transferase subunit ALG13
MSASAGLRLLVVVGTDHHPFDRLINQVDDWLAEQDDIDWAVVQFGQSSPPRYVDAQARPLLGHDELQQLMQEATIVVTHGGPATILEARRHGILPITVPRDPRLGEHVDEHQQRFARMLGSQGLVLLAETADELETALTQGRDHPASLRVTAESHPGRDAGAAVAKVGAIIDELVEATTGRRRLRSSRHHTRGLETVPSHSPDRLTGT